MRNIPSDLQREWKVGEEEDVRFVQTSVHAHTYRDAIEFESGRRVRLQELREGMRMDVLCLAASVSNDQGTVPRGDEAHAVKFR